MQSIITLLDIQLVSQSLINLRIMKKSCYYQGIISSWERRENIMRKTIRVRVTATPVSKRSVRVRTSVTNGGSTRTRVKTINL